MSHAIIYSSHTNIIWNLCIFLHTPLMLIVAKHITNVYHRLLDDLLAHEPNRLLTYKTLIDVLHFINNAEIISLLALTLFSAKSFWGISLKIPLWILCFLTWIFYIYLIDIHVWSAIFFFSSCFLYIALACSIEYNLKPKKKVPILSMNRLDLTLKEILFIFSTRSLYFPKVFASLNCAI